MSRPRPIIAIVGRPNVGKSSLFNRLAGGRVAIVHDQPGVTRDRLHAVCRRTAREAEVVDTGGIGAQLDDGFTEQVRAEADIAVGAADMILFLVDVQEGLHPVDEELAASLRRAGLPVALVVNKTDAPMHEMLSAEFSRLGFEAILPVSATHGRGMDALVAWLDARIQELPDTGQAAEKAAARPMRLAVVGRPNVGKSSLVNALIGESRAIVSEVAGTTRDAVDVPFSREGEDYLLIDTAGLRPRSKRDTSVEVFSAMRTEEGIRRSDVTLLVLDAASGITAQDRTVARMVLKAGKPCCLVLNKFDAYDPERSRKDRVEALTAMVRRELFFLSHAPFAVVSALRKQHLIYIFRTLERLKAAAAVGTTTGRLNRVIRDAMTRNPPPLSQDKKRFKVLYAACTTDREAGPVPVPAFALFVNRVDLLTTPYRRYLESALRAEWGFEGLPLLMNLRPRREGG